MSSLNMAELAGGAYGETDRHECELLVEVLYMNLLNLI